MSPLRPMTAALLMIAPSPAVTQSAADAERQIATLIASPRFRAAAAAVDRDFDRTVREIIAITEIPAPPFGEAARGRAFAEMLRAHGLTDVGTDAVGNVTGLRRGTGPAGGPLVVVSAHMDTVFPAGTSVKVRREGERLYAPGVGDDSRGLAVILAMIRALDAGAVHASRHPVHGHGR